MAVTKITKVKTPDVNLPTPGFDLTAATSATDGFLVDCGDRDHRTVIFVSNTNATTDKNLTVKAGDSPRAGQDIVISCPKGKMIAFTLDSGYFKITKGTDKGNYTMIPESTDIQIAVAELM